jgi:hypothetical protein
VSTRDQPATKRRRAAPTRRVDQQQRNRRRALIGGGVAVAVLVLVTVWIANRDDGDDTAVPAAESGVAHVHGLGIDPADGTLYVATHHGTFRLPDRGEAQRVGDLYQDTMGFTVVGDGHFLGSGHPDAAGIREGQPPLLGLIESTDAGQTWQPVSLSGEVDFHALAYAHDQVYGWDSTSGRFMVSANREDWDRRSTLDLYTFAVDPDDAEHIVATTPDGLVESTDGGRAWDTTSGPPIVVLAWDATSGLWGADPEGGVHHSADGGTTWDEAGSLPGAPQALLATADVVYAAAMDENDTTGIYQSSDDGQTWTLRYRDEQ